MDATRVRVLARRDGSARLASPAEPIATAAGGPGPAGPEGAPTAAGVGPAATAPVAFGSAVEAPRGPLVVGLDASPPAAASGDALAPRIALAPRGLAASCSYCRDGIGPGEHRHGCGCGAAYHLDCWVELDRCGTLGCAGVVTPAQRSTWGLCPHCTLSVRGTFRWERAACGRCGVTYHAGCRAARRRCATPGCRGRRTDWAAPASAAPAPPRLRAAAGRAVAWLAGPGQEPVALAAWAGAFGAWLVATELLVPAAAAALATQLGLWSIGGAVRLFGPAPPRRA